MRERSRGVKKAKTEMSENEDFSIVGIKVHFPWKRTRIQQFTVDSNS